jgi:predicted Na+-dependent transporter
MRSLLSRTRSSWPLLIVALCVALMLMIGTVQAAHFHPDGQLDHDCALCVAVHSVANTTPLISLHFSSQPVATIAPARALARPRDAVHFRLASRPPPADPALSA